MTVRCIHVLSEYSLYMNVFLVCIIVRKLDKER